MITQTTVKYGTTSGGENVNVHMYMLQQGLETGSVPQFRMFGIASGVWERLLHTLAPDRPRLFNHPQAPFENGESIACSKLHF